MFFADENLLGLGKLLCREGRTDVVYPGHKAIPEIELGAPDLDWLPIAGDRSFIVLSRDKRIRTRPAELEVYSRHRVRSVWLGGKRDLGPAEQLALFLRFESRLRREIEDRGEGPWAVSMAVSGIRPINLRSDSLGKR